VTIRSTPGDTEFELIISEANKYETLKGEIRRKARQEVSKNDPEDLREKNA
jgi:hypothetical protein